MIELYATWKKSMASSNDGEIGDGVADGGDRDGREVVDVIWSQRSEALARTKKAVTNLTE